MSSSSCGFVFQSHHRWNEKVVKDFDTLLYPRRSGLQLQINIELPSAANS